MKSKHLITASIFLSIFNFKSIACEHLELGVPKQSDYVACYTGYAVGYNYNLKSAEWVSYKLYKQVGEGVEREDDFRADPNIPLDFQTTPQDYDEPIYDMGHLAPSESIDTSKLANSETFLMSNMMPQLPGFNRAIWRGAENRERKQADKRGYVFVFSGPVLHDIQGYIGKKVPIPSAFYKIIYDPVKNEAMNFLLPHKADSTSNLSQYLASIDEIEAATGLDFLNLINDVAEEKIESVKLVKQWK